MAVCGFMAFLFEEGVIYKCLYPNPLTRIRYLHIVLEFHLLAASQTTDALAKIIAVTMMYQAKLTFSLL